MVESLHPKFLVVILYNTKSSIYMKRCSLKQSWVLLMYLCFSNLNKGLFLTLIVLFTDKAMDAHLAEITEESFSLCNFPEEYETSPVLEAVVIDVKDNIGMVTTLYQQLMLLCQQKRDLFIVVIKYHMIILQVR